MTQTNEPRKNLEAPFALLKLVNIFVYRRHIEDILEFSPETGQTWVIRLEF